MQNIIFQIVLITHIVSGLLGLVTGTLSMATVNTTSKHKKIGKYFFYAMIGIFATSIYLSFAKNNLFLLLVGFFSFYLAATGYRALYFKKLHIQAIKPTLVDYLINYTGVAAGLALLLLSIALFLKSNMFCIVTAIFGSLSFRLGYADIKKFKNRPIEKLHWLDSHGLRMAGAYTSTVTAFIVVNVSINANWVLWILPAALIIPITKKLLKKFKTKKMNNTNLTKMSSPIKFAILALVLSLSSCAYNNKFLAPRKYDVSTKKVIVSKSEKDSLIAHYEDSNFQPTFLKNGIDTLELNYTIESVNFPSTTGYQLNGWMLKHKTVAAKHTIVNFHGNGGSILGQSNFIIPMLNHGFQIFVFDYSGYGFSTGTAKRQYLPKDALSSLIYVKQRADCNNQKIIVYGQSYGGHLAASIAHKATDLIDAVVIEGGFSNHRDLGSNGAKPFIAFMSKIFIKEFYNGSKLIAKNKKPLLIIHSKEDETIPYKMGEKLFKNATSKKDLYTITGKHLMGTKLFGAEIAKKINEMVAN